MYAKGSGSESLDFGNIIRVGKRVERMSGALSGAGFERSVVDVDCYGYQAERFGILSCKLTKSTRPNDGYGLARRKSTRLDCVVSWFGQLVRHLRVTVSI